VYHSHYTSADAAASCSEIYLRLATGDFNLSKNSVLESTTAFLSALPSKRGKYNVVWAPCVYEILPVPLLTDKDLEPVTDTIHSILTALAHHGTSKSTPTYVAYEICDIEAGQIAAALIGAGYTHVSTAPMFDIRGADMFFGSTQSLISALFIALRRSNGQFAAQYTTWPSTVMTVLGLHVDPWVVSLDSVSPDSGQALKALADISFAPIFSQCESGSCKRPSTVKLKDSSTIASLGAMYAYHVPAQNLSQELQFVRWRHFKFFKFHCDDTICGSRVQILGSWRDEALDCCMNTPPTRDILDSLIHFADSGVCTVVPPKTCPWHIEHVCQRVTFSDVPVRSSVFRKLRALCKAARSPFICMGVTT